MELQNFILVKIRKKIWIIEKKNLRNAGIFGFFDGEDTIVDSINIDQNETNTEELNLTVRCYELVIPSNHDDKTIEICINMIMVCDYKVEDIDYISCMKVVSLATYMCISNQIIDTFIRLNYEGCDTFCKYDDYEYEDAMIYMLNFDYSKIPLDTILERCQMIKTLEIMRSYPTEFKIKYVSKLFSNNLTPQNYNIVFGINAMIIDNDLSKCQINNIINCVDGTQSKELLIIKCIKPYDLFLKQTPNIEINVLDSKVSEIKINSKPIDYHFQPILTPGLVGANLMITITTHISRIMLGIDKL